MRNLIIFTFLFFVGQFSVAQGLPEEYVKAKNMLVAKDYWGAINAFKPLTDADEYGNLANYAAFHLAEASLAANQPAQAITALQPIYGKNWNRSDETKYLLAIAYFQNNQNSEALRVIKSIKSEQLKVQAFNASYQHLLNTSSSYLVANLDEFKANEGYTAAMASVLKKQTIMSASEIDALKQIRSATPASNPGSKDEVLDIVVILPFTGTAGGNVANVNPSDFVFELYQGIEFEVDRLRAAGKDVNLITFDSKRNLDHLNNLFGDPDVKKADVIIGPIYQDESDAVSGFAERAGIPFIHPLSNLGERFEQTEYSYLFRPSVNSLSKGITSGLKSQNWGKRVAIAYSGSSRDEKLGQLLQSELQSAGFQVAKSQRVDARNASGFLQDLGISRGNSPSVDQIVVLTDDPAIGQSVFSLMESITTSIPVLVMDSWLGFNFANYEMLEAPHFYFISNNTPKFDSEAMNTFREGYYERYFNYPSLNTILGAELINWLGSNLSVTYGFDLSRGLTQSSFQKGQLTWGFNFQNSNNNSYTPVFKLEAGQLVPLQ